MTTLDNHLFVAITALVARLADDTATPMDGPPNPDATLEQLGVDSLRLVQLITELESAYGFQFDHDDVDVHNFATLEGVVLLVERYLNGLSTRRIPAVPGAAAREAGVEPAIYHDLPAEGQLLMCTAKLCMTEADLRLATEILRRKAPALDWGRFLDLAGRHRVINLVGRSFARERLDLADIVPHWIMTSSYLYNRQRNLALLDELSILLAELRRREVNAVVRKGTYLTSRVYPDPALRFSVDLDLYVSDADRPGFCQAMADLGYQQGMGSANGRVIHPLERQEEIFSRLHEAALPPFRRVTSDPYVDVFTIDPSHNLMPPASGKSVPAADFLSRAHRELVAGEQAWVCCAEDVLLDLGVHLFREATSVCSIELGKDLCLIRFIDIVEWWRAARDRIGLDRLVGLASQYDLAAELYYALHFTDVLYPHVLPAELLDRLRPADLCYLENYGAHEGLPGTWQVPFAERIFDPRHGAGITLNP